MVNSGWFLFTWNWMNVYTEPLKIFFKKMVLLNYNNSKFIQSTMFLSFVNPMNHFFIIYFWLCHQINMGTEKKTLKFPETDVIS